MAAENADIPHHPQIKYSRRLIPRRRSKEVVVDSRESSRGDCVFVTVKSCQASGGPGIPELDLMILGAGDQ